jgi:hypothetical protein
MDSGTLPAVAKIVRGSSTVVAEAVCRICGLKAKPPFQIGWRETAEAKERIWPRISGLAESLDHSYFLGGLAISPDVRDAGTADICME